MNPFPNKTMRRSALLLATLVVLSGASIAFAAGNSTDTYDDTTRTITIVAQRTSPANRQTTSTSSKRPVTNSTPQRPNMQCTGDPENCHYFTQVTPRVTGASVQPLVLQAVAEMQLPEAEPQFGPRPDQNQWGMIPVGYPIWLWLGDATDKLSLTVDKDGIEISLSANRTSATFTMGDGHTVTCTAFTQRPTHLNDDPMRPSPNCGYVYQTPNNYEVTATAKWLISWQADGQRGQLEVTDKGSSRQAIQVGELLSVIAGGPS